jgi:uncharacterized membrane protein
MDFALGEWTGLALRWVHLIAGIAWIGSSFYFMWLDSNLRPPPEDQPELKGELWSVHGGGFYRSQKWAAAPQPMPEQLHWFKWEAYSTWLSGFLLLTLIFYIGADTNLIDRSKLALEPWQGIAIGLSSIAIGLAAYELLCRSPLRRSLRAFGLAWFLILSLFAFILTRIFSGHAAFLHVGAIIGTVMAANVFLVIIPNQKKSVAQLIKGEAPDPGLGISAKQRSTDNNYMTLPVLFMMISNHFPAVFGSAWSWLWLMGLSLVGILVRHFFNLRNVGKPRPYLLFLAFMLFYGVAVGVETTQPRADPDAPKVTYAEARAIVDRHCISCHASRPSRAGISVPPLGVHFDDAQSLRRHAERIYQRAVISDSMPLANETGMTPIERQKLGAWIKAGADPQ